MNKSLVEKLKTSISEETLKRVSQEKTTLRKELSIEDQEFEQFLAYAKALKTQGRWRDASDIYYFLSFLDPQSIPALSGLGQVELTYGSAVIAYGIYQNLIAQYPQTISPYFKAVECCLKLNEPLAALYYLELFQVTFTSKEQRRAHEHQYTLLKAECDKLLLDNPPNKDLSHVA